MRNAANGAMLTENIRLTFGRDTSILAEKKCLRNSKCSLPGGQKTKFVSDHATYLGTQLEGEAGLCFGIAAGLDFLLVCSYEENGENPELVIYKKR